MTNNIRKSLVAEFDELVRNRSVLSSGNEPGMINCSIMFNQLAGQWLCGKGLDPWIKGSPVRYPSLPTF